MAQSDLTIQNQSFPSFRSDLNDALTALNTTQSGTSRPSSAVAGTIWLDTTNATNPTLKLYDGSDDISLATLDYSANTVNWLDSTVSADLVNDTTPQLGGMLDVNGQAIGNGTEELIKFSETASAVNEVTVTNSATGNAPELSATGDDTNIDIKITPKGSGNVVLDGLKYPNADGTADQFLKTDGSGNLSFAEAGGGKVLQVVYGTHTSQASTTSTSFVDVSANLNISLTCSSASNKVLIFAHFNELYFSGSHCMWIRVTAGGTEISKSECVLLTPTSGEKLNNQMIMLPYSPSSTSAIEYKMQFRSSNGTEVRVNQNSSTGGSSLVLMEIKG